MKRVLAALVCLSQLSGISAFAAEKKEPAAGGFFAFWLNLSFPGNYLFLCLSYGNADICR